MGGGSWAGVAVGVGVGPGVGGGAIGSGGAVDPGGVAAGAGVPGVACELPVGGASTDMVACGVDIGGSAGPAALHAEMTIAAARAATRKFRATEPLSVVCRRTVKRRALARGSANMEA